MPFASAYREVYEAAIKPAVNDAATIIGANLLCRRGDETVSPGCVTREIVHSIHTAEVVIADLTSSNPNVFYELGVAYCLGNKTIMITQDIVRVPFEVNAYRLVKYEPTTEGLAKL